MKDNGIQIDLEVQETDNDDHQRRVHYNSAILTTMLPVRVLCLKTYQMCMIFISKFDIFEGNFLRYHIDRVVREIGQIVDNGFEEFYVNTKIKSNSEVSEFMEVFVEDNAYNNKFPKTSDGKRRYKEIEGGLNEMCEIMERITTEEIGKINKLNVNLIQYNRYEDLRRPAEDPSEKTYFRASSKRASQIIFNSVRWFYYFFLFAFSFLFL